MKSEHSIVYGNLFQPAQFLDWRSFWTGAVSGLAQFLDWRSFWRSFWIGAVSGLAQFLDWRSFWIGAVSGLSSNPKNEDIKRDQVDNKEISSPGVEHVEECDSTETGPVDIATLDPEAEEHTKDSNTFTAS